MFKIKSESESLDNAWALLNLTFKDREDHAESGDYFKTLYGVEYEALEQYWQVMMEGEDVNEFLTLSLFCLGFELGKIHEKYERDMAGDM